jgi:hypothetical protein
MLECCYSESGLIFIKVCDVKEGGFDKHLQYGQDKYQKPSVEFILKAFRGEPLPKAPRTPKEREELEKA